MSTSRAARRGRRSRTPRPEQQRAPRGAATPGAQAIRTPALTPTTYYADDHDDPLLDPTPPPVALTSVSDPALAMMTRIEQSIRDSEARMMRSMQQLREEVRANAANAVQRDQATERWRQDDRLHAAQDEQMRRQDAAIRAIEQQLPKLPTKDEMQQMMERVLHDAGRDRPTQLAVEHLVDSHVEQYCREQRLQSEADVDKKITAAFGAAKTDTKLRLDDWRTWMIVGLSLLSLLQGAGVIHLASLFAAKP